MIKFFTVLILIVSIQVDAAENRKKISSNPAALSPSVKATAPPLTQTESTPSSRESPEARLRRKGFHLEPYVAAGPTRFNDYSTTLANSMMLAYDIGASAGFLLWSASFVGLTFDWQYFGQMAANDNGNFSGSRFNLLAPTFATYWAGILFKMDIQLLGSYQFRLTNSDSADVEMNKPLGIRLTANFPKFLTWKLLGADLRLFTALQVLTYGGYKTTTGDVRAFGSRDRLTSIFLGFSYIY